MLFNASFITAILCMVLSINAAPATNVKRNGLASSVSGGGLEALTRPVVEGVANPLTTGAGRGVAGSAAGTQQTSDLLGEFAAALYHTLGKISANAEQGAGVAPSNSAPAVQDTVKAIQNNSGAIGDIAKIVGGA